MPFQPSDSKIVEASLRIPFATSAEAEIAFKVLSVDQEPRRNFVEKKLSLDGSYLQVQFKADQTLCASSLRYLNRYWKAMPEHTPAPTPHRAVYGFAFYLLFLTLSIVYMLWALLPIKELSGGYFSYLPDKYFALCLPMLVLCGLFFFIFLIYPAIGLSMTPNVDELSSVLDTKIALRYCAESEGDCIWEKLANSRLQEKGSETVQEPKEEMCEKCNEKHKSSNVPPIATLRFLDLSEMNKEFFG